MYSRNKYFIVVFMLLNTFYQKYEQILSNLKKKVKIKLFNLVNTFPYNHLVIQDEAQNGIFL